MYYRLWNKLYKILEEKDPENEVLVLMNILKRENESEEIIKELINELLK